MHTQVLFIDKNKGFHKKTTNLQNSESIYLVRASYFAQCSSIKNENGGFVKDLYPKENMWTRTHLILKKFRQKRRSC